MSSFFGQPSTKLVELLRITLERIEKSPDISGQDMEWLEQFFVRAIAELEVSKSEADRPEAENALLAVPEEAAST